MISSFPAQLLQGTSSAGSLVGRLAAYRLFQSMYQTLPPVDVKDIVADIKNSVRQPGFYWTNVRNLNQSFPDDAPDTAAWEDVVAEIKKLG